MATNTLKPSDNPRRANVPREVPAPAPEVLPGGVRPVTELGHRVGDDLPAVAADVRRVAKHQPLKRNRKSALASK
ncbi:MAG: hypothetical protein NVSMB30_09500 [Hymenobacter sp.]